MAEASVLARRRRQELEREELARDGSGCFSNDSPTAGGAAQSPEHDEDEPPALRPLPPVSAWARSCTVAAPNTDRLVPALPAVWALSWLGLPLLNPTVTGRCLHYGHFPDLCTASVGFSSAELDTHTLTTTPVACTQFSP